MLNNVVISFLEFSLATQVASILMPDTNLIN
jgi:hypothetical protein